jgi:hypothetical protein
MHPAPRRDLSYAGLQFVPHWAIERVEKSALDPLAVGPGRTKAEQRAAWKSYDFLDIPAVSADRDDVARGELWISHALGRASGVPEEEKG